MNTKILTKDCCRDVRPIQHAVKPRRIRHVSLQGRQKDLRSVTEYDNTQRDGEGKDVDAQRDLRPSPSGRLQKTIAHDQKVDDDVGHCAPKAERRDVVEVLEEGAG